MTADNWHGYDISRATKKLRITPEPDYYNVVKHELDNIFIDNVDCLPDSINLKGLVAYLHSMTNDEDFWDALDVEAMEKIMSLRNSEGKSFQDYCLKYKTVGIIARLARVNKNLLTITPKSYSEGKPPSNFKRNFTRTFSIFINNAPQPTSSLSTKLISCTDDNGLSAIDAAASMADKEAVHALLMLGATITNDNLQRARKIFNQTDLLSEENTIMCEICEILAANLGKNTLRRLESTEEIDNRLKRLASSEEFCNQQTLIDVCTRVNWQEMRTVRRKTPRESSSNSSTPREDLSSMDITDTPIDAQM